MKQSLWGLLVFILLLYAVDLGDSNLIPKQTYKSSCTDNRHCSVGEECVASTCVCDTQHRYINNTCTRIVKHEFEAKAFDVSCGTDPSECAVISGSFCNTTSKICECLDNFVISSDITQCLPISTGYMSACVDTRQCSERLRSGGTCANKVCVCIDGFHYFRGQCWKSVGLSGTCQLEDQCIADADAFGATCTDEKCKCSSGYYQREYTSCRKKSAKGENCLLDSDCAVGNCKDRICQTGKVANVAARNELKQTVVRHDPPGCTTDCVQCDQGYFLLDGACFRELGTSCAETEECTAGVEFSVCSKDFCVCEPNLRVPSVDQRSCLKSALGQIDSFEQTSCQSNEQCYIFTSNAVCKDKMCACNEKSHWDSEEKLCWVSKNPGDSCQQQKDCSGVENMSCGEASGTCKCNVGYHTSGDGKDCRPDSTVIDDPCKDDEDCNFDFGHCDETTLKCQCQDHYSNDNGQCVVGLGLECQDNTDCKLVNSICSEDYDGNKTCQCVQDYVGDEHFRSCLKVTGYKEDCEIDAQCKSSLGELSMCQDLKCECRNDSYYDGQACFVQRSLGDSCAAASECYVTGEKDSAMCMNGVCRCNYGYVQLSTTLCAAGTDITKPFICLIIFCLSWLLLKRM